MSVYAEKHRRVPLFVSGTLLHQSFDAAYSFIIFSLVVGIEIFISYHVVKKSINFFDDIEKFRELLNKTSINNDYLVVCLFITDIINNGSYVLCSDRGIGVLKKVYKDDNLD